MKGRNTMKRSCKYEKKVLLKEYLSHDSELKKQQILLLQHHKEKKAGGFLGKEAGRIQSRAASPAARVGAEGSRRACRPAFRCPQTPPAACRASRTHAAARPDGNDLAIRAEHAENQQVQLRTTGNQVFWLKSLRHISLLGQ